MLGGGGGGGRGGEGEEGRDLTIIPAPHVLYTYHSNWLADWENPSSAAAPVGSGKGSLLVEVVRLLATVAVVAAACLMASPPIHPDHSDHSDPGHSASESIAVAASRG